MEVKKTKKADIEGRKGTWLLMGLIIALSFMFVSFEWANHDKVIDTSMRIITDDIPDDMTPVTNPPAPEPPPPPPPPAVVPEIVEVTNNTEVDRVNMETLEDLGARVEIPRHIVPATENAVPLEPEIFEVVEDMPDFKGGTKAMMSYLSQQIKYPTIPLEQGVQGTVVIQFVVDTDGSIINPVVLRSVDPYLDKEAMRVISTMPPWNPGKQRGTPVRVKFTVPVKFSLK